MFSSKIKTKIENNQELSYLEIIKYIRILPYNRTILNDRKFDIANYILENFDKILSNMNITNFLELLDKTAGKNYESIILEALNKNMRQIVEILNSGDKKEFNNAKKIFSKLSNPEILFKGKFDIFYNLIDKEKFFIIDIFKNNRKLRSLNMKSEYIEVLIKDFESGNLRSNYVCWFIYELILSGKKQFLIEHIEDIITITDSPLRAIMLIDKIKEIDMNNIIAITEKRIDVVIQELNERNLNKPLNNLDNLIDLFNFINKKPIQPIVLKALNGSIKDIIEVINNATKEQLDNLKVSLSSLKYLNVLLEGHLFEFYENIDSTKLDLEYIFNWNYKLGLDLRDEFFNCFETAINTGKLRPNDTYFFAFELQRSTRGVNILNKYAKKLINITNTPMKIFSLLEKANINVDEIREIVDLKIDDIVYEMIDMVIKEYLYDVDLNTQEKVKLHETIKMFLIDTLKNENIGASYITKIGQGSYGIIYGIGDKILKIGLPPKTYNIPRNCKRFLQPIVRYKHDFFDKNGKNYYISFKICEKCEDEPYIQESELYEVYKDIRKKGMIWTDARFSNVGRLLKDNVIHFNRIEEVYAPNIGFKEVEQEKEVLKKRRIGGSGFRLHI